MGDAIEKAAARYFPLNGANYVSANYRVKDTDGTFTDETNVRNTAQVAIADANPAVVDLRDYFAERWNGTYLWLRCSQNFQFFFSDSASDAMDDTSPDADSQGFPWDANELAEGIPPARFLHIEAAAAGTLFMSLTSMPPGKGWIRVTQSKTGDD